MLIQRKWPSESTDKNEAGISCSFVSLEMILVDSILFRFSFSFNYLIDTIWIFESWFAPLFNELGIVFTISSNLPAFIYACMYNHSFTVRSNAIFVYYILFLIASISFFAPKLGSSYYAIARSFIARSYSYKWA